MKRATNTGWVVVLLACASAWNGCQPQVSEADTAGTSVEPRTAPVAVADRLFDHRWLVARFANDEAQPPSQATSPDSLNQWKQAVLNETQRQAFSGPNVLDHQQGAGPHGSNWNPANDLHCLAFFPLLRATEVDSVHVHLNGMPSQALHGVTNVRDAGVLIRFDLPLDRWRAHSRMVEEADYSSLYADRPDVLESWQMYQATGDVSYIGIPPDVGEVIHIEATLFSHQGFPRKVDGWFHATYGE